MNKIDSFRDEYFFLSNFYNAPVEYEGITYLNNEAVFQAQKLFDVNIKALFSNISASDAKKLGRRCPLRNDWNDVKIGIMLDIVRAKFAQHKDLAEKLIATGDAHLIEGNTWNDRFWGVCNGQGANHLGKILMQVRKELKEGVL